MPFTPKQPITKVVSLSTEQAAYIAGFLDGEGYVTVQRANRTKARIPSYRLRIGFTNTDLPTLLWLHQVIGAGNISAKARRDKLRHSPAFELTLNQRHIQLGLIRALLPFARIKKAQLELGLAFLALPKIRRPGKWPKFFADPADLAVRETYKLQMGDLNQRGPQCLQ